MIRRTAMDPAEDQLETRLQEARHLRLALDRQRARFEDVTFRVLWTLVTAACFYLGAYLHFGLHGWRLVVIGGGVSAFVGMSCAFVVVGFILTRVR